MTAAPCVRRGESAPSGTNAARLRKIRAEGNRAAAGRLSGRPGHVFSPPPAQTVAPAVPGVYIPRDTRNRPSEEPMPHDPEAPRATDAPQRPAQAALPLSLDGVDIPVFAHLDRAAAEHPRRTAIRFHNARVSYAGLKRLAETGAAALRAAGLKNGDRVAVMLPNSPQAIITYYAVLKAGGPASWSTPCTWSTNCAARWPTAARKWWSSWTCCGPGTGPCCANSRWRGCSSPGSTTGCASL